MTTAKIGENKFFAKSEAIRNEPAKAAAQFSAARASEPVKASKMGLILGIAAGVVILGMGGLIGYLYMQNSNLSSRVAAAVSVGAATTQPSAANNDQVAALTASNTALLAQVSSTNAAMQQLSLYLSFYAVPTSTAAATPVPVTLSGVITGGGKLPYAITTSFGVKVYVSNWKDAKLVAILQPIVGSSTQLSGTFIPGSDSMTVNTINGASVQ
jgi:hypothetical protein